MYRSSRSRGEVFTYIALLYLVVILLASSVATQVITGLISATTIYKRAIETITLQRSISRAIHVYAMVACDKALLNYLTNTTWKFSDLAKYVKREVLNYIQKYNTVLTKSNLCIEVVLTESNVVVNLDPEGRPTVCTNLVFRAWFKIGKKLYRYTKDIDSTVTLMYRVKAIDLYTSFLHKLKIRREVNFTSEVFSDDIARAIARCIRKALSTTLKKRASSLDLWIRYSFRGKLSLYSISSNGNVTTAKYIGKIGLKVDVKDPEGKYLVKDFKVLSRKITVKVPVTVVAYFNWNVTDLPHEIAVSS